jgi:CheY-like chemotaxis protein
VNAAQAFATADPARNRIWARGCVQGDRLVVEIEDNGPGIALDVLPRIFDPFFTTKPVGQGTGLGLSISYNLVAALGGELTCSTVLGKGTCFRASLPRAVGAIREQDAVAAIAGSEPRGRVLVIDDEEAVLAATARLLLGAHDVVAISDPREAVRRLLSGKEQFDVVFCDLMMPYLTGIEVYRRVREKSTELADRFVFVSGGVTREEVRIFLDEVPNERLEKPFSSQNLRGIVRRLVGRGAAS